MIGMDGERVPHGRALRTLAKHQLHMDIQVLMCMVEKESIMFDVSAAERGAQSCRGRQSSTLPLSQS